MNLTLTLRRGKRLKEKKKIPNSAILYPYFQLRILPINSNPIQDSERDQKRSMRGTEKRAAQGLVLHHHCRASAESPRPLEFMRRLVALSTLAAATGLGGTWSGGLGSRTKGRHVGSSSPASHRTDFYFFIFIFPRTNY